MSDSRLPRSSVSEAQGQIEDGLALLKEHQIDTKENIDSLHSHPAHANTLASGLVLLHSHRLLKKYHPLLTHHPEHAATVAQELITLMKKRAFTYDTEVYLLAHPKDAYHILKIMNAQHPDDNADFLRYFITLKTIFNSPRDAEKFAEIQHFIFRKPENARHITEGFIIFEDLTKGKIFKEEDYIENKEIIAFGGGKIVINLMRMQIQGLLEKYHKILKQHPDQAIMISEKLLSLKNDPDISTMILEYPQFAPVFLSQTKEIQKYIIDNLPFALEMLRALTHPFVRFLPVTEKINLLKDIAKATDLLNEYNLLDAYGNLLMQDPSLAMTVAKTLVQLKNTEPEWLEFYKNILMRHAEDISGVSDVKNVKVISDGLFALSTYPRDYSQKIVNLMDRYSFFSLEILACDKSTLDLILENSEFTMEILIALKKKNDKNTVSEMIEALKFLKENDMLKNDRNLLVPDASHAMLIAKTLVLLKGTKELDFYRKLLTMHPWAASSISLGFPSLKTNEPLLNFILQYSKFAPEIFAAPKDIQDYLLNNSPFALEMLQALTRTHFDQSSLNHIVSALNLLKENNMLEEKNRDIISINYHCAETLVLLKDDETLLKSYREAIIQHPHDTVAISKGFSTLKTNTNEALKKLIMLYPQHSQDLLSTTKDTQEYILLHLQFAHEILFILKQLAWFKDNEKQIPLLNMVHALEQLQEFELLETYRGLLMMRPKDAVLISDRLCKLKNNKELDKIKNLLLHFPYFSYEILEASKSIQDYILKHASFTHEMLLLLTRSHTMFESEKMNLLVNAVGALTLLQSNGLLERNNFLIVIHHHVAMSLAEDLITLKNQKNHTKNLQEIILQHPNDAPQLAQLFALLAHHELLNDTNIVTALQFKDNITDILFKLLTSPNLHIDQSDFNKAIETLHTHIPREEEREEKTPRPSIAIPATLFSPIEPSKKTIPDEPNDAPTPDKINPRIE